jgi:hypothetical protein
MSNDEGGSRRPADVTQSSIFTVFPVSISCLRLPLISEVHAVEQVS